MWSEVRERSFFGLAKIKDAEEGVTQVRENLRIAQSRQKSYADKRQRDLEFEVGDFDINIVPNFELKVSLPFICVTLLTTLSNS